MLTDDAVVSMPPEPEWHRGRDAIDAFLRERLAIRGRPWRFVATAANGQPAFAYYIQDREGWARCGLLVVGVSGDGITSITRFKDEGLLDRFDLPVRL